VDPARRRRPVVVVVVVVSLGALGRRFPSTKDDHDDVLLHRHDDR
jgi:hypothetical protein